MSYDFVSGFQYTVDVHIDQIPELVRVLTKSDAQFKAGTSFAITSETHDRKYRRVHLSVLSYKRLIASDLELERYKHE